MNEQTITDLKTCGVENPSFPQFLKALWLNPGFLAIYCHRKAAALYPKGGLHRLAARFFYRHAMKSCGCDISARAIIGKTARIVHPVGVVISAHAKLGEGVKVYQNVTIGQSGSDESAPTIKDGAQIFAGAVIVGGVTIGENAFIGANAFVKHDVPDNKLAVGVPAKIKDKK